MDLEMFILSEVSQTEKDKYLMISLIGDIFKKWYERIYLQNKTDTQTEKATLWLPKGKDGEG